MRLHDHVPREQHVAAHLPSTVLAAHELAAQGKGIQRGAFRHAQDPSRYGVLVPRAHSNGAKHRRTQRQGAHARIAPVFLATVMDL